jgi:hypothetical protein
MSHACQLAFFSAAIFAAGPLDAAEDDAPHATSSYIMSAISAGLPKFDPAKSEVIAAAAKAAPAPKQGGAPAGVTIMPAYTITEAKVPTARQAMTYKGWTQPLIDEYMGPSDGIDRGVLNRFTLAQLWAKIPILGRLPFIGTPVSMTISERALDDAGANNPLKTTPIE